MPSLCLFRILFLCIFCLSKTAFGSDNKYSEATKEYDLTILQVLEDLKKMRTPNNLSLTKCEVKDSNLNLVRSVFSKVSQNECNIKDICFSANAKCIDDTGSKYCLATDPLIQNKRTSSAELSRQVFQIAKDFFDSTLDDSKNQKLCCNDDLKCIEKFKKTSFSIVFGYPNNTNLAYTAPPNAKTPYSRVSITKSRLLNCMNKECIEAIILHELGHACQYSKQHYDKPGTNHESNTRKDLIDCCGEKVADCVLSGQKQAYKPMEGHAVYDHWVQEAFANTVFFKNRINLGHLAFNCLAITDFFHGPIQPIFECLLKNDSEFKDALCKKQ